MRKQFFFLLPFLFLFFSCKNKNQKHQIVEKENTSIDDFTKDSIAVNYGSIGTYSFKFNTNKVGDSLKSINVYSSNNLKQVIKVDNFIESKNYQLIDVNFDGFKDIVVLQGCGSGGCGYWVWNFSPKDRIFQINEELSDRFGLKIDSVHKLITFSYSGGWNVKSWDTFQYLDGKLFLLSSRNIDGNDTVIFRR